MAPTTGVDHAPTIIAVASTDSTEAHGISPPIAVPASTSPVARQSGGPETPMVSNDAASATVFANHIAEHPGSDVARLTCHHIARQLGIHRIHKIRTKSLGELLTPCFLDWC